jgi:hypothetical protein
MNAADGLIVFSMTVSFSRFVVSIKIRRSRDCGVSF